jgi:hypothetical protein
LWTTDVTSGRLHLLARAGDQAMDSQGAPLAGTFLSKFTSCVLLDGAGTGPVFLATLRGPAVNTRNGTGLFAAGAEGMPSLVLRTEDILAVSSGGKTLRNMTLFGTPAGDFGTRRSYNATGSLALLATFTDRTQALVRIDLP